MTVRAVEEGFSSPVAWCRSYDGADVDEQTAHMAAGHRILWNDPSLHRYLHEHAPTAVPHIHLPADRQAQR